MDRMIGKYRARMKETGLVLIHPVGISFDLSPDQAVELMEFIDGFQDAIEATPCHESMDRRQRGINHYRARLKSRKFRRGTAYGSVAKSEESW